MIYCKEPNLQLLYFAFVQKHLYSVVISCQTGAFSAVKSQPWEGNELFLLLMLPWDVPNSSQEEFFKPPYLIGTLAIYL